MPEFEDMSTDEKLDFLKRELGTTRQILAEVERQFRNLIRELDGRVKALEQKS